MADDNLETNRKSATAMQRASQAWHLRVIGHSWQQIADTVGYADPANAHPAVQRFAGTIPDPKPDELRNMWRARMERLWSFAARDAEQGRLGALRAGAAIADRAGKLDGLDAPTRYEITPDEQRMKELIAELLERSGHAQIEDADVLELEVLEDSDPR